MKPIVILLLAVVWVCPLGVGAQSAETHWTPFLQGGLEHRFNRDIDDQSEFSVTSFSVGSGLRWSPDPQRSVGLSLAYTRLDYEFEGSRGFSAFDPWGQVDILSFGLPVRWGLGGPWSLIVVPTLSLAAEEGADLEDGVAGGAIAALAYRFSRQLTVGGGIGAFTQIEDHATVFPFFTVRWQINDQLMLNLGRSDDTSSGPGLGLIYAADERWQWLVGASYRSQRFRLDDQDAGAEGVGDDSAYRAYAGVRYKLSEQATIRLLTGLDFGGELELEDESGRRIAQDHYDTAPFIGLQVGLDF